MTEKTLRTWCTDMWPMKHGLPLPAGWVGVSVENQAAADARIPWLLQMPAVLRFVRYTALGPLNLHRVRDPELSQYGEEIRFDALSHKPGVCYHAGVDWVICGGESGPNARPCALAWLRSVVQQCYTAGVPCFVTQLGARPIGSWGGEPSGHAQDYHRCLACIAHDPFGMAHRLRDRKGATLAEWPADLRVQCFPESTRRRVED